MGELTMVWSVLYFVFGCCLFQCASASVIDNLYCGQENCYEILGMTMESTREEIARGYRQLARKWHPDAYRGELSKEEATEVFQKIANAYEILSNEETRADYDYLLQNPEAYYEHYYRYYSHRVAPKVDWRIVVAGFIAVVTSIQYGHGYFSYWDMIKRVGQVPKFRMQALHLAKVRKVTLPDQEPEEKTKDRAELKRRAKEYEEQLVIYMLSTCPEDIDIGLITLLRPVKFENTLLVQLVYFPVTACRRLSLYFRFYILHKYFDKELTPEDQLEMARLNFGLPTDAWGHYSDEMKEEYMEMELWNPEKFAVWKEEHEAETRRKLATQSGRYRQAKRWEKNHANDRMYFED